MAGKKGDRTRPGGLPGEFFFSSDVMRKRSKDEEGQEGGGCYDNASFPLGVTDWAH